MVLPHGRFTSKVINKRRWRDCFAIVRSEVMMNDKGRGETMETIIPATGTIQPASAEHLERLPEGDRNGEIISVRTGITVTAGNEETQADSIVWRGERYLVMSVTDWRRYGFSHALAALMKVRASNV